MGDIFEIPRIQLILIFFWPISWTAGVTSWHLLSVTALSIWLYVLLPLPLDYFNLLHMCLQWLLVTLHIFSLFLLLALLQMSLFFCLLSPSFQLPTPPSIWPSAVCDLNYFLSHSAIFTFSFINFTYTSGSSQLFVLSSVVCSLLHIHLRVLHRSRCSLFAPLDSFSTLLHLMCDHGGWPVWTPSVDPCCLASSWT